MHKQQDYGFSRVCTDSDGRSLVVAAVFDGHGSRRGEQFSQLCSRVLADNVSSTDFKARFDAHPEQTGRDIFSAISEACFEANKQELDTRGLAYSIEDGYIRSEHLNVLSGGSTGTILFVNDAGCIYSFHVGDSDAWFVSGQNAHALCVNHSPSSESEYERVHASWPDTKFEYHYQIACNRARHPGGSHVFPKREDFDGYYVKNVNGDMATIMSVGTSHLAMTRSFGDEPLRCGGLSAEPDYKCVQADASGIIRVASDGFWDNLKNGDMVDETKSSVTRHGYDADTLNSEWLVHTHEKAKANFGAGRDNMWAYTICIEKIE